MKIEIELENKKIGKNELFDLRDKIDRFVRENFDTLYEGACRLKIEIEEDYYAPRRVQICRTRLHETIGLKYADGHKNNDLVAPHQEQLIKAVADIQQLLDAAAEDILAGIRLQIVKS